MKRLLLITVLLPWLVMAQPKPCQDGDPIRYVGASNGLSCEVRSSAWGSITGTLSNQTDLQSALDGKSPSTHNHAGIYEPAFASGLASQFFRGDKTWQTLDKTAVGLGNVDNTSDADKPISTATQTALNDKAAITLARKQPVLFTDCLNILGVGGFDPFYGAVVSSGTINAPNAGLITTHHPGVVRARSSTTTNSGYWIGANAGMFLLGGGEAFEAVFNITTLTNGTFRLGFHDATTSADAVDGAYLEVASTGVGTGKTASNSTRSTTATTYTLSAGTWYRLVIAVNSGATSVAYYLYNDAGTQLWTDSLATNIPTASGRETGAAIIGTNSGTSATDLYHLDWVAVYFSTARTR